jgi:arylsulfatase A-like enzyme
MVLAGPGIPSGTVVEEPVSIIDLMPTVLGMADLSVPALPGVDLRDVIGGDGTTDRILYAQQFRNLTLMSRGWGRHHTPATVTHLQSRKTAAVLGTWKRILVEDGSDMTFDLVADPAELHPLRAAEEALPARLPRPAGRQHHVPDTMDPGTEAALRALGYIH